jgi:hypothetical protein
MSTIFQSVAQLKHAFELDTSPEYTDFTPYEDRTGFSVLRRYPEKSRYKPPTTKEGAPVTFALIGVRYDPERINANKPNLVPITLRASIYNKYLSKHFDYDFNEADCPTEESLFASNKTPKPLDLISYDEIFYDHNIDKFVNKKWTELSGIEIINDLFNQHISTIGSLRGRIFRLKVKSITFTGRLVVFLENITKSLMKLSCGYTLQPDNPWRGALEPYHYEDLKLLSTERLDVFGYKASKNIILTFSFIIVIGYILLRLALRVPLWLKTIGTNTLLSFAFAVLLISILDYSLPKLFFYLVNKLIKWRINLLDVGIKFK